MIRKLARMMRRFRREDGNATVEFVVLFPFFIGLFGSAFEASLISTRQVLLNSAVDRVTREYQLGNYGSPTHGELKVILCNLVGFIPECTSSLTIELERIDRTDFAFNTGQILCADGDNEIEPVTTFESAGSGDFMLMTVCAAFRPMVPITGLGLKLPKINGGNYYGLFATTAFVVEPA